MKVVSIKSDADFDRLFEEIRRRNGSANGQTVVEEKLEATQAIVDAVRRDGDEAVSEFTRRFDGVDLKPCEFELGADVVDAAIEGLDRELVATLERAHDNIYRFHSKHLRESWEEELEDGSILGQRINAIESAGVYVPGGKAFYPSSVLMNIVPAKVAGVDEIIMVSPPSYEGTIHPAVLAAARIAGATRIFRVGGAQAIAALAFGTDQIPGVLKITGPGNSYVTAAKRLVQSVCSIDTEAGPSEVTVIADEHANARLVAGELLAQAEHDEEASCILITPSAKVSEDVRAALEEEVVDLSRVEIIRSALESRGLMIIVRDMDEAARLTDIIAPEHLAIYTQYPRLMFDKIRNAGAVILGEATTVVLGDYIAGPNHILPTGGRARFASPLSAEDFRKVSSVISFTPDYVRRVGDDVMRLANIEELTAHARAIENRQ